MKLGETYQVPCIKNKLNLKPFTIAVPGSKSITNRALLLSMLADGKSELSGILFSDDSRHFLKCLESLNFSLTVSEDEKTASILGLNGALPTREASLYVGSAGTAARFLSAVLGVSHGKFYLDASEQMKKRPMAPLLEALRNVGCEISFSEKEGFFPFTLHANGFQNTEITIDIDKSSQFLSALLIAAPLCDSTITIKTVGTHGMAYIDMTIQMMAQFGITVLRESPNTFVIPARQHYKPLSYQIEPDVSAACYFYAMAAILGTTVTVSHVHFNSLQGDIRFLSILEEMGCTCTETAEGIQLTGPADGKLNGITVDMSACSDQAITLAAIAPFASSPVTITGIGHIRHQESDRLSAIAENLHTMGISCEEGEDCITIQPGTPKAGHIKTHDDHRLAMGFSITGLRTEGLVIEDPACCRKTFENFYDVLELALSRSAEIS